MAEADLDVSFMPSVMPSEGKITSEGLEVKCAGIKNDNVDDSSNIRWQSQDFPIK